MTPPSIVIDHIHCTRCIKCIKSCPAEILVREKNNTGSHKWIIAVTDSEACYECRACEVVCPEDAIRVFYIIKEMDKNVSPVV